MNLTPTNILTLFDPTTVAGSSIVLTPGANASISINGKSVLTETTGLTQSAADLRYPTTSVANTNYLPKVPASFAGQGASAGTNSFAFGLGAYADKPDQVVIGRYNAKNGFWYDNGADNNQLFLVGNGTSETARSTALAVYQNGLVQIARSLNVGDRTNNSGSGCLAVGDSYTGTTADCAVAIGRSCFATAFGAAAIGGWNSSTAYCEVTLNDGCVASGPGGFASGYATTAGGADSFSSGEFSVTLPTAQASFAACNSAAEAPYSSSFGLGTKARSYGQMVVGRFNVLQGTPALWSAPDTDDLFVVGNGDGSLDANGIATATNRRNAFTVKGNGDVRAAGAIRVQPSGDLSMGGFQAPAWTQP